MRFETISVIFVLFSLGAVAQPNEFNQPWKDSTKAIILDPFSANFLDLDSIIKEKRVTAIIHKATEGFLRDAKYDARKSRAKDLNLLWGSYHLGRAGDPIKQADFYLSTIGDIKNEVIALDLEDTENKAFMNKENSIKFIDRIKEKTGRFPILYANQKVIKDISEKFTRESVFGKCLLWYARFKREVTDFPGKIWSSYTIWQFTSEINCCKCVLRSYNRCKKYALNYISSCPFKIPGIKCDMDLNVYNGSIADLRARWPNIGL